MTLEHGNVRVRWVNLISSFSEPSFPYLKNKYLGDSWLDSWDKRVETLWIPEDFIVIGMCEWGSWIK